MEIPGNNTNQGAGLLVSQPNNTPNEKWRILPAQGAVKGKGFVIQSALNNNVADINGGNVANGTDIIVWSNGNQLNQTWCIAPV